MVCGPGAPPPAEDQARPLSAAGPSPELCAAAGTVDVVDANLALLVRDGDALLTSDGRDLDVLLRASGCSAWIIAC